jgi:hypothetical protein
MKIVTNEKLIKRNKKIGQVTSIGSLVILGLGLYFSFQTTTTNSMSISFTALILGFLLSQVGIFYGNRWGRSPRPDELIAQSLKGLEDKYILYNYTTSVPHLLVGPAGVWALIPYTVKGIITYDEKKLRWKHKGGNFYLKLFAQETMGRPDLDTISYQEDVKKYFSKQLDDTVQPPIQAALVFTNEKASIDAANAPVPTLALAKLKDFFRKKAKEEPAPIDVIKIIQAALPKE